MLCGSAQWGNEQVLKENSLFRKVKKELTEQKNQTS